MAQTFTLEQAADKLGLSPEEFKRRLREEWKSVRSFRDGPTLRFRAADIEELARSLGQASDPGLTLAAPGLPLTDSSEEIPIAVPAPKSPARKPVEQPLLLDDDTSEDALAVPMDSAGSMRGKAAKASGDSDVRLDLTPTKGGARTADVTEEISLELPATGGSGVLKTPSSVKLSNPKSAKLIGPGSAKIPGPAGLPAGDDGSSEFELSLDSDSDSFELTLNPDSSAEVDLGTFAPDDRGGSRSGIKLNKPADSGVSLEKKKKGKAPPVDDSDSDIDFELTLDAPGAASGVRLGGPKSGPKSGRKALTTDSDSEFELSLDDNSGVTDGLMDDLNADSDKGDIFETDFELPVVSDDESGSEVVAIESGDTDLENSDFDIAIVDSDAPMDDESASQVVLVDDDMMPIDDDVVALSDDDMAPVSPGRKRRSLLADDDVLIGEEETDDGASASKALRGVRKGGQTDDDTPIRTGPPPPAKWGVLPALFLLPCLVVVVLGGLMTFEMLRGQWGYNQPSKPSDALVRGVAKTLDMKVTD